MQRSVHVLEWHACKWGCRFHACPMQKRVSRKTSSEVGQWLLALSVFEEAMFVGKAQSRYHDTSGLRQEWPLQTKKSRHWNLVRFPEAKKACCVTHLCV